jgi:chromosomal replication initiation ATPase DnaA
MKQIALPLDELRPGASSSLIITDSNASVAAALANASTWPGKCAILCGPGRSGKSLLARYFTTQADGIIIDNADSAGEEVLFNAWNRAQESTQPLLLVSRFQPSDWQIELADLRSRLSSALLLNILPPDDELISQLIQKHLAERGTSIGVESLAYVTKRMERSYAALEKFARDANAMALEENSAVNMSLVRRLVG